MQTEFVYAVKRKSDGWYLADRYHSQAWTPSKALALTFGSFDVAQGVALSWDEEVTGWILQEITPDGEILW